MNDFSIVTSVCEQIEMIKFVCKEDSCDVYEAKCSDKMCYVCNDNKNYNILLTHNTIPWNVIVYIALGVMGVSVAIAYYVFYKRGKTRQQNNKINPTINTNTQRTPSILTGINTQVNSIAFKINKPLSFTKPIPRSVLNIKGIELPNRPY
jgi:hypothetical protein